MSEDPAVIAMSNRPYVGHEGLRRWARDIRESFERFELELQEVRELPRGVVALGLIHLEGIGSDVAFTQAVGYLARFEDGLVRELRTFTDHEAALAAGLA